MNEEEYLDDQNTGLYCRLCLHWTDDALCAEQMVDIFSFNENLNSVIADKIHECLGLYTGPDETASNICLNCVHTISFINEFRILCQQTEKLYDSAKFRFNDASRWKRYNDHIGELRALVRDQRDWVENILYDSNVKDISLVHVDVDDVVSPEFIKVEDEESDSEQPEEYIEAESLLTVENDEDPSESNLETVENSDKYKPASISNRDKRFGLKLKIAHELQAQMSERPDFKAVGKKLDMKLHEIKHLWKTMKELYRRYKKRAYEGHEIAILRLRKCPLFTVLNILVPKFEGDKPYKDRKVRIVKNTTDRRRKIPLDLQVTIAEEIKAHPELWDMSLNSSAHTMNIVWREMAKKLSMDMRTLRTHWRRMRDVYRWYKLRELRGFERRKPSSEKLDYLLSLLHELIGSTTVIGLPVSSTEQKIEPEEETEEIEEENGDDGQFCQQEEQLELVQEIQKYPIVWCYKHPNFHDTEMRDHAWLKIAEFLVRNCESIKRDWRRLKDIFRNRYLRLFKGQLQSDDPLLAEPCYEMLHEMFQENMRMGSKTEQITDKKSVESDLDEMEETEKKFDKKTMFEFAKVCFDNDILWNTKHPDYNEHDKQNEVWELIALQFDVSLEEVKYEWKNLRNQYRSRNLRSQNKSNKKTDKTLETPLHQLISCMFDEHSVSDSPKEDKNASKAMQVDTVEPFSTQEELMKLVEEVSMHDILWNVKNPDYKKSAMHELVYAEIAPNFGYDPSIIKEEWKKLRRRHQHRQRRIARGRLDPTQEDVNPLNTMLDNLLSPNDQEKTGEDESMNEEAAYPKRRFTGKRSFSDDGCIKINVYGTLRYAKICELCGKQVERSYFEYHMNAHYGLTPYACSVEGCGKQFSNKVYRDRHEIIIHGEDGYKFQCDQCDMKFKQKAKYEYHYAVKHKSDEVPCDICGKVLKHKKILVEHMRIHAVNYECPVCGKVLQKKYSLNVHMRVHTKEKPYPCELCDQRFMLKVQMKTHLLKVHGVLLEELLAATALDKS